MKDVPTEFPDGLHLAVICRREDPRDAFIPGMRNARFKIQDFKDLPHGAKIGTSSLRRSCQLLSIRPDLKIEQLRGNLDTRLRKLDEGQFNAIILAAAGMKRLGLEKRIGEILPFDISLPAIGQGAVGIECRVDDTWVNDLIAPLNHPETAVCVKAERAFLKKLEGGCQVPIAAHARIEKKDKGGGQRSRTSGSLRETEQTALLLLDGLVGSLTGERIIKSHREGKPDDAEKLGIALAEEVLARGAKEILDELYGRC